MMKRSRRYRSFETLYEDNKRLVFHYLNEKTDVNQDPDELSSQVWERAGKHHKKLMKMDKLAVKKYLILTVCSVVMDDKRRAAQEAKFFVFTEPSELEKLLDTVGSVEDILQQKADQAYFRKALQMLSEDERQILFLYRLQRKPSKEIAKLLGISDSNVRVKVHRIVEKLKGNYEKLKEEGEEHVE